MQTYDCLVIGGGPAGLSAAIYAARYNRTVLVVDSLRGRWQSHEINENYLGFPNGVPTRKLRALGRRQAARFGVHFHHGKVTQIRKEGTVFVANAGKHEFEGCTVILATGVTDNLPDIGNTEDYWGRTLFWCITCDGWKVRGKRVTIVGKSDNAAIVAMQFLNFTDKLAVVTNCEHDQCEFTDGAIDRLKAAGIPWYESPIDHVEGEEGIMNAVVLEDGTRFETDYMFNQQGCTPRTELAVQLGVKLASNGYIEIDTEQRTNVPFVYAAGDVTKDYAHQVVTAAHEGATCGMTANYDLYRPEQKH
jgi:thioredoxin reductase (NADPH)